MFGTWCLMLVIVKWKKVCKEKWYLYNTLVSHPNRSGQEDESYGEGRSL